MRPYQRGKIYDWWQEKPITMIHNGRVKKETLEKEGLDPKLPYIGTFVNQKNRAEL